MEIAVGALEEVFEMALYEDSDKRHADIINGNLTRCSADMVLFARNFSWISRINGGNPSTCGRTMFSSSVC